MIDPLARSYVRSVLDTVPARSGNMAMVLARGRRQRIARYTAVAVAGVVMATAAAVAVAALRPTWPVAVTGEGDVTSVELPGQFIVQVVPGSVVSEGAHVYQGQLGPEPAFDTTDLGTEIPLIPGPAADLVVPIEIFAPLTGDNALHATTMIYLGEINGAQIALDITNGRALGLNADLLCGYWGNGTQVTGGGKCPLPGHPLALLTADPPLGNVIVWTRLPENTSVVTMTLPDGSSYWQRPTSSTVFFDLADGRSLAGATLTALDGAGTELVTMSPT